MKNLFGNVVKGLKLFYDFLIPDEETVRRINKERCRKLYDMYMKDSLD